MPRMWKVSDRLLSWINERCQNQPSPTELLRIIEQLARDELGKDASATAELTAVQARLQRRLEHMRASVRGMKSSFRGRGKSMRS
jgi:hypothetical protein